MHFNSLFSKDMGQVVAKNKKKLKQSYEKAEIVDDFQEKFTVKDIPVADLIQENQSLSRKRYKYHIKI